MAFQDDLKKVRDKFAEAGELGILEGETKETSEALLITLLSELERNRVIHSNELDANNKKMEDLRKQIFAIQDQINVLEKQNAEVSIKHDTFANLGAVVHSNLHTFLVKAGKLKVEERRAQREKAEKEAAFKAHEAKLKAEAEAKAAEEARLKAEAETKAAEEARLKAEAEASEAKAKENPESKVVELKAAKKPRKKKTEA